MVIGCSIKGEEGGIGIFREGRIGNYFIIGRGCISELLGIYKIRGGDVKRGKSIGQLWMWEGGICRGILTGRQIKR